MASFPFLKFFLRVANPACPSVVAPGDHRLALLLSQAAGSQYGRELLALQLADWNRTQTDGYLTEERLRIFMLLAGKPVGGRLFRRVPRQAQSRAKFSWDLPIP